jgi:hypothetical protein
MRLSQNFYLEEFLISQTAERHGGDMLQQQRNPDQTVKQNLQHLVNHSLQPLRTLLKTAMTITSGYRCLPLNRAIGSRDTSQHLKGQAADIKLSNEIVNSVSRTRIKSIIRNKVKNVTGKPLRDDINANFYLFATTCFYLDELDIDQVIHEFGSDGQPSWVHLSCSDDPNRDKRQILVINSGGTRAVDLVEALNLGC